VFLVSHDRRFLDNVVTSTIAWEGDPAFGGRPACGANTKAATKTGSCSANAAAGLARLPQPPRPVAASARAAEPEQSRRPRTKLSYKEQRELDALPARIEALEAEQKRCRTPGQQPSCTSRSPSACRTLQARHEAIEEELLAALERWEAAGLALTRGAKARPFSGVSASR
jgi:ATP-binding cassette subfamily F protein uup